jgi:hypothetical protein
VKQIRGRIRQLWAIVALAAACAAFVPGAAYSTGGADPEFGYGKDVTRARAFRSCDSYQHRVARYSACLSEEFAHLVEASNPPKELPLIDKYVATAGGYLEANCHLIGHAAGRQYGAAKHVSLAQLRDLLPRTNNAGCSAGFTHGLITYLAPQIAKLGAKGVVRQCNESPTRYQRYSCIHGLGHAYMRMYADLVPWGVKACKALGVDGVDCAQGAFMDYWMSLTGVDETTKHDDAERAARKVCGNQRDPFIRPCWYHAFLEYPPPDPIEDAGDIEKACDDLEGEQRAGCITGASVTTSADPFTQMGICADLDATDATNCVRGVRVPSVALSPMKIRISVIQRCANLPAASQRACYYWLGKVLNVVSDGKFGAQGCSQLRFTRTRAVCRAGAASYQGPLVTFS